ncbi:MAG: formate dehydrogenase accessory sulfurtransferase FdhD, partial [Burkholderiales bacterium]|nr:formate dehydrogenase accessory sulfurtransferase FdhD [Burkholderiales bacterium]
MTPPLLALSADCGFSAREPGALAPASASALLAFDDAEPLGRARVEVTTLRDGAPLRHAECVADEVAVAIEVNGIAHAVMLATPLDLDDFALGFLLGEGLVGAPGELLDVEPEATAQGITLRLTLTQRCLVGFKQRRRTLGGRTGCGLCGVESIEQAMRPAA